MIEDLQKSLPGSTLRGSGAVRVTGIAERAELVTEGDLYVALKGLSADGHDFVGEAVERGARALMVERWVDASPPQIKVPDGRTALARAAVGLFGRPHRRLVLLGVTGTNGKTSTAHLVRGIWERSGEGVGILGTIGHGTGERLEQALLTTPGAVELNRRLRDFADGGCSAVVMEVSSHAVSQHRIEGLEFDGAIFTNVTRDHLDYHATFEEYVAAKAAFCRSLLEADREKGEGTFVYGQDDPTVRDLGERYPGRKVAFGLGAGAAVRATGIEASMGGTSFTLETPDWSHGVRLRLPGTFNVLNALAAAGWAWDRGLDREAIAEGLERVSSVPGRFESLRLDRGPVVIVDYAHTPDALDRVLEEARTLTRGRVIVVFGCGGDRDPGKRPMMGEVGRRRADVVIVTSDNPRTEDPESIIEEILGGVESRERGMRTGTLIAEPDRRRAIHEAVALADEGDLVVVAGKGHEDYQILGETRIAFDDREVVREALRHAWGGTGGEA